MGIGVDNVEQQCLECGRTCCNRRSLGNHVARSHKQLASLEKYVLKHNLNGIIPSCRCGCGKNVLWHKLLYCYNNFVNGHNPSNFIGFQHSAEQISYRNEQIRKTYETNPNLSDKIAASVVQAFKDPTKKKNLHDGQVRGWKDPVRRRKLSERNIAMLEAGIIGPQAPFKTQWILNPFTGKQEYMHSSWETAFLQQCAQKQLPVSKVHSI